MQAQEKPDRYVSFKGIECAKNTHQLITMLRQHLADPEKNNPFWEKFEQFLKDAESGVSGKDYLFLIHSYINNLEEFFEDVADQEALRLLKKIEVECC